MKDEPSAADHSSRRMALPDTQQTGRRSIDSDVRFSVKELLARIEGKIDGVITVLATKADRIELDTIRERITSIELKGSRVAQEAQHDSHAIEARVAVLERSYATSAAVQANEEKIRNTNNRQLWSIIASILALIGTIASFIRH